MTHLTDLLRDVPRWTIDEGRGAFILEADVLAALSAAPVGVRVKPRIVPLHERSLYGVGIGGRWDGWVMIKHPDGHWVSHNKPDAIDPMGDVIGTLAALTPAPADAPADDAAAKGETDGQMLERLGMDGAKWAAEFRTTALRLGYSDMDEGWLIGWFANAIMAGYDRAPPAPADEVRRTALMEAADVLGTADDALTEAEAILGGEYGDHYGPLCETMLKLRSQIKSLLDKMEQHK